MPNYTITTPTGEVHAVITSPDAKHAYLNCPAGHLLHGNVDLHAIGWLLVGSIPGVLLGSHLSIRVPDRALRVAFAFVLALSGIKLVDIPEATTIIEVTAALGLAAFAVWSVRQLQQRRVVVEGPA